MEPQGVYENITRAPQAPTEPGSRRPKTIASMHSSKKKGAGMPAPEVSFLNHGKFIRGWLPVLSLTETKGQWSEQGILPIRRGFGVRRCMR